MKKLMFAVLLLGATVPGTAFAQDNEPAGTAGEEVQPEGGDASAPASDKAREKARLGAEIAGHMHPENEQAEDPTEQFNFFSFDYRGKDEYGGAFGDGKMVDPNTGEVVMERDEATGEMRPAPEEPMSAPFVLMLLNFGVFLIILGKYGAPVARKVAADRHDQIKNALDEAAKLREQAQKKLSDLEGRIKGVDAEIKQLVDDIRASAENDKQRILETARAQAETMKRDAEQRIAAEIEMARAQLTKEVTAAAAAATEQLLKEKVNADDQARLVSTFITNVQGSARQERR